MNSCVPRKIPNSAMRRRSLALILVLLASLAAGCGDFKRFMYAGFGRDDWQQPDRVLSSLELRPGERVADLGAGGGFFTFRLAKAVGPEGRVYAVDVDEEMLDRLEERAGEEGAENVEVILAKFDDPLLPAEGVDLVFTCNTYHHFEDRSAYFERVRGSLRPGGRVAIIDFNGTSWFNKVFGHSTPPETIRSELEAAGYALASEHHYLSRQGFLVFTAAEP